MRLPWTFMIYLMRLSSIWLLSITLSLTFLAMVIDTIELFRRAAGKHHIEISLLLKMVLLKAPYFLEQILPMAILIGTTAVLWTLRRHNEFIAMRAAGLSTMQVLIPLSLVTVFFAFLHLSVVNPLSASFYRRYELLDNFLLRNKQSMVTLSDTGLWVRQKEQGKYSLARVERLDPEQRTLQTVTLYHFDRKDTFLWRLDVPEGHFVPGGWKLTNGTRYDSNGHTSIIPHWIWPNKMSLSQLREGFSSPDSLSVWELPRYIRLLKASGFASLRFQIHFQRLLAQPILFIAMVLLATATAYRFSREKGMARPIITILLLGFGLYFLTNIFHTWGLSTVITPFWAAWIPPLIGVLVAGLLLLHLENE